MISRFLLISHFLRPIVSKMRAVGLVDGCGQCHHMLSYSMVVGGPVMIHADSCWWWWWSWSLLMLMMIMITVDLWWWWWWWWSLLMIIVSKMRAVGCGRSRDDSCWRSRNVFLGRCRHKYACAALWRQWQRRGYYKLMSVAKKMLVWEVWAVGQCWFFD